MSEQTPSRLNLANEIRGAWDHSIVMTYTAELDFFERAILPLLSSTRGRLIFVDAPHLLESQARAARERQVRALNRTYLTAGISMARAAHAKIILLVAADRGRLLIGSANMGLMGWASVGELFTRYDFTDTDDTQLDAFLSVRALLDRLVRDGFVDAFAGDYLDRIWQATPWLVPNGPDGVASPVRSSLSRPLADQLVEQVASLGSEVDELIMLAPFHDASCDALDYLMRSLRPKKARLLVQPLQTSARTSALRTILERHRNLVLQPFDPKGGFEYVHAKLLIAIVGDRAACLQGSANLSRPALLKTVPDGNLEVSNLLVGSAMTFKALLRELELGQTTRVAEEISVSFASHVVPDPGGSQSLQVLEVRWEGATLVLRFVGSFGAQPRKQLLILVGREQLVCRVVSWESGEGAQAVHSVRLELPTGADSYFARAVAVMILADDPESAAGASESDFSNPLFCVNQPALLHQLGGSSAAKRFADVGLLDIADDGDLEELLRALQGSMVFDKRTLLDATGSLDAATSDDISDEDMLVAYEDVDYEALRQNPRLRQYAVALRLGMEAAPILSDIQLALRSITDAFNEVVGYSSAARPAQTAVPEWMHEGEEAVLEENIQPEPEDSSSVAEEEVEEETEEELQRRWSSEARMRVHWRNFIKRFLAGMSSKAWRELAGDAVIAGNYLIFSHVMERIHRQKWIDLSFLELLLRCQAATHAFVWGPGGDAWLDQLAEEERKLVLGSFADQHVACRLIVDLAAAGNLTREERFGEVLSAGRIAFRDVGRTVMSHAAWSALADPPNLMTTASALARDLTVGSDYACWLDPPSHEELLEDLRWLLDFWSEAEVVRILTDGLGIPAHSGAISNVALGQGPLGLIAREFRVDGKVLVGRAFPLDELLPVIALWARVMPDQNLRLALGRSRLLHRSGTRAVLWSPTLAEDGIEVEALAPPRMPWDPALESLEASVELATAIG